MPERKNAPASIFLTRWFFRTNAPEYVNPHIGIGRKKLVRRREFQQRGI